MNSIRNHVYAIKELLAKGNVSNKFSFSDSFLSHMIATSRATVIKEKITKEGAVSEFNYNTLCLPMEKTTFHNCNCVETDDCFIYRSIDKLPLMVAIDNPIAMIVMNINGEVLDFLTVDQNKYAEHGLSKRLYGWFLHDNRIYVLNAKNLKTILLKGIFQNPEELSRITTCIDNNVGEGAGEAKLCKSLDEDFSTDPDLIEKIYLKVLFLLGQSRNYRQDTKTLNSDDTII